MRHWGYRCNVDAMKRYGTMRCLIMKLYTILNVSRIPESLQGVVGVDNTILTISYCDWLHAQKISNLKVTPSCSASPNPQLQRPHPAGSSWTLSQARRLVPIPAGPFLLQRGCWVSFSDELSHHGLSQAPLRRFSSSFYIHDHWILPANDNHQVRIRSWTT